MGRGLILPMLYLPVEHGIECCDFIYTHRRNFDNSCNLIHDRDGSEAILSLAEIKKRHDGSLLVLRRIALHNLFNSLLVVLVEFERNAGIIFRSVAVLKFLKFIMKRNVKLT
jgi:hypothetical protein